MEIPLPEDDELSKELLKRLNELPPLNIYRMIANAPTCLIPWTNMVKGLYESKVDIRYKEIAILRQAYVAKAKYELHQHKFIAQSNKVTKEEIEIICSPGKVTRLKEVENLLCQMAEELELTGNITDPTLSSLQDHFDQQELVELIVLLSFFCAVGRFTKATRVLIEKENPLEGADSPH